MGRPEVSVIIPVYNGERYIRECLESVLHQTMKALEVIVIQHDSDDGSEQILREYREKFPALKVINRTGLKLSEARNLGLREAAGAYIGFLDADDFIEKDMYEKLYLKVCRSNADVVVCDYMMTYTDREDKSILKLREQDVNVADIGIERLYVEYLAGNPCLWNKIYRADTIKENDVIFEVENGEDLLFNMRLIPYLKRIATIPDCCYHYRQRRGSLIHESITKYSRDSVELLDAYLRHPMTQDKTRSLLEYYAFANMITGFMFSNFCVKRPVSFYKNQLAYMRKGAFYKKFCYKIAWTRDLNLLYKKGAMSIRFYMFQKVVFGLCSLRCDWPAAVIMYLAGRFIEAKYQYAKSSFFE